MQSIFLALAAVSVLCGAKRGASVETVRPNSYATEDAPAAHGLWLNGFFAGNTGVSRRRSIRYKIATITEDSLNFGFNVTNTWAVESFGGV